MRKSSSTLIFIIGMGFLVLFPLKYFPAITGEESRRCSLYSLIFAPIRTGTQPAELSPELDKVNRRMWRPFTGLDSLGCRSSFFVVDTHVCVASSGTWKKMYQTHFLPLLPSVLRFLGVGTRTPIPIPDRNPNRYSSPGWHTHRMLKH